METSASFVTASSHSGNASVTEHELFSHGKVDPKSGTPGVPAQPDINDTAGEEATLAVDELEE